MTGLFFNIFIHLVLLLPHKTSVFWCYCIVCSPGVALYPCSCTVGCLLQSLHTQRRCFYFNTQTHAPEKKSSALVQNLTMYTAYFIFFSQSNTVTVEPQRTPYNFENYPLISEFTSSLPFSKLNVSNTVCSVLMLTWILNSIFVLLSLQAQTIWG